MKNFKSLAMSVIGSICLHTAMAATVVEVAVTPEAKQTRQDIWPTITQVLMTAPLGDVVTVFDSTSGWTCPDSTDSLEILDLGCILH